MKSLWRSAWPLERRSPALFPVVPARPIPATRRGRKSSTPSSKKIKKHATTDFVPRVRPNFGLSQEFIPQANTSDASTAKRPSQSHSSPSGPQLHAKYSRLKACVNLYFEDIVKCGEFADLKKLGIRSRGDLMLEAAKFRRIIHSAFDMAIKSEVTERNQNPFFWNWRNAAIIGTRELLTDIKYSFYSFILREHLPLKMTKCHEKVADLRHPHEWYPATRTLQRKIYLHVGPTNSGKTYNALKALENSNSGIYAGPLRLLAHEVYARFTAKGKRCALITGEELKIPEGKGGFFASCTVEMTPLNRAIDVAVIDEIQMIGDEARGWAWTQALLGVQAREVHLCGEDRTVQLIQEICAKTGDEVVVHRYKRLSGLEPMSHSLGGNLKELRKGDAVVSFSRINLHSLKAEIEKATGKKCAIVYGSLPPESRAQQAALFNNPDNDYDFLTASDAIGMGLNLEIRRVIFEAVVKNDGNRIRTLTIPELKQIGGRAGRYRTAARAFQAVTTKQPPTSETEVALPSPEPKPPVRQVEQVGLVTTLREKDLAVVHASFKQEAEPLRHAGIFPPTFIIKRFASCFPADTPLTFILLRLRDIGRVSGLYQMCSFRDPIAIAHHIHSFPLSVQDRCTFLTAPACLKENSMKDVFRALVQCVVSHSPGGLLDIKEINLEILDWTEATYAGNAKAYLKDLEALHKSVTLYLWLSYRFFGVFQSQALAFHVKTMVEERINKQLERVNSESELRTQQNEAMRKLVYEKSRKVQRVFGDDLDVGQQQEAIHHWPKEEDDKKPLLHREDDPRHAPSATQANM